MVPCKPKTPALKDVLKFGKTHVSIRLDTDILEWIKASGERWQTRINYILREYMEKHK